MKVECAHLNHETKNTGSKMPYFSNFTELVCALYNLQCAFVTSILICKFFIWYFFKYVFICFKIMNTHSHIGCNVSPFEDQVVLNNFQCFRNFFLIAILLDPIVFFVYANADRFHNSLRLVSDLLEHFQLIYTWSIVIYDSFGVW